MHLIPSAILKEIYTKAKNSTHDREITDTLVLQLVGVYPVSSAIQLNTGEKGLVTKVNWGDSMNPIVTIYYDNQGRQLRKPVVLDLSKQDMSQANVRKIKSLLNLKKRGSDPDEILIFNV